MKDLTQYPEALDLKKLGFQERCLGHYWENLFYFRTTFHHPSTMPNSPESCLTPTYAQAFRWFREKHDMGHSIDEDWDNGHLLGYKYVIYEKEGVTVSKTYHTYEEAELDCLKKLIEIVKGGNK
jgi:hypothetical protein